MIATLSLTHRIEHETRSYYYMLGFFSFQLL